MPQIQTVNTYAEAPNRAQENLEKLFSNLSEEYGEKQARRELDPIWEEYTTGRKDFRETAGAIQKSSLRPKKRAAALEELQGIEKTQNDMLKARSSQAKANLQKESEFDKKLAAKGAEAAVNLEEQIPKYRDSLTNLDYIEKLAKKELRGVSGYAKSLFNSKSAKEVENLSAASLDSIIKTFNPAGTLPTAKLNWIRDTFAVKASDRISNIEGKINAQRILGNQTLKRAEDRLALLKEYKGNIPAKVSQQFDLETQQDNDAIADELAFKIKLDESDGDVIEGMYDQNGEKLGPIPKDEAKKLFEAGLITNEPK